MATIINKWNFIMMGYFSLDIIFRELPSIGKSETITPIGNGTPYFLKFPSHTLATDTCYIPNLYLSDPNKLFTDYPHDLKQCINSENPLLNNNQTHIWVETNNLHHYNATDDSHFRCCYKTFHLSVVGVELRHQGDDKTIKYHDCILFNKTMEAIHEFVRIYCYYNMSIIYDQLFAFAIKKPIAIPPLITFLSEAAHAHTHMSYNVLLFGMGSVSQQNFHRTMTKTNAVLKDTDVVDFFGYNSNADTKLSNLMPMLVGKKSSQVECGINSRDLFIWEQFKEQGFFTALMEDANISSISFCEETWSPTDYYFKPFLVEAEDTKYNDYCTGDKYTYKILINYIEQLVDILQESKLFGIFWQSSMSTQDWNYPIVTDEDYEILLQNMIKNGHLNQTVLILLSDLGTKYSSSKEGYLEERLPLFKMILPPSFRTNYDIAYNNLRINSQRLITAYDVHATLMDLADLNAIRNEEIIIRSMKDYSWSQSISLFLPIPSTRTCSTIGLDSEHCICFERKTMNNLSGITAKYASKLIVPVINEILEPYPQCPFVQLSALLQISKFSALHLKDNRFMEYRLRVETKPAGIFEATVRFDVKWSVVSDISRIDYDERMSYCVNDPFIKLYCFCKLPRIMKLVLPES